MNNKVEFQILLEVKENLKKASLALDELNKSLGKSEDAGKEFGKEVENGFEKVAEKACRAEQCTAGLSGQMEKLGKINLASLLQIVQSSADALNDLTRGGMDFGQSMADLGSITGIAGGELEQLEENARKVGVESGLGAGTAARAYAVLASQIDVATIGMEGLNELQEKSVTLAQASGMSLDAAALSLSGTINQFGLSADQAGRVVNVLAAGSKYGAAEIEELSQSFKVAGSSAAAMGMTVEQSAGALEVLSKANLKGSEAGTALRNIILKLNTELGADLSRTSLGTALDALKPRLADAAYLSKLFGMENVAAAQYLIQNSAAIEEMTAKVTGSNVAQEQAAVRTGTTAHKMEVLQAKVNDLKISIADSAGGFAAYGAVISENAITLALAGSGVMKLARLCQSLGIAAKMAAASTTLMNRAMAANPYLIAAAAAAALAGGVYLLCQRTSEAEKAQQRLEDATGEMHKEISTESARLNILFDALKNAKEGTLEWQRAKGRIEEQYGNYLKQLGIEITDVNTARAAYTRLSAAILETARSRASEKALAGAGDALADKEGKALNEMRNVLTENYGEETGRRVFEGIASSIRRGEKEIPERWMQFVRKLDKEMNAANGAIQMTVNPLNDPLKALQTGRALYEKEVERIRTVLGTPIEGNPLKQLPDEEPRTARKTNGKEQESTRALQRKKLTLSEIKEQITELQTAQQTASDADGRTIQQQIVQLEALKKSKEKAMGINTAHTGGSKEQMLPAQGSIAALESEMAALKRRQEAAPISKAVTFQADIERMEEQIARARMLAAKGSPVMVPLQLKPLQAQTEITGPLTGQMKQGMKLPKMEFPAGKAVGAMEGYRDAVEAARLKNEELAQSMGGIGSTMSSLGGIVGGASGQWLQWGDNVVQAIAAAIPQIVALSGVQQVQAEANTKAAVTGAAASVGSIPFVGPVMAVAAIASVLAALSAIPFANGGIISGPTLGLMGEYPGAQNNPEVVAPLNKLRSMLQPSGTMAGEVEFKLHGRMLRGVLQREEQIAQRTR